MKALSCPQSTVAAITRSSERRGEPAGRVPPGVRRVSRAQKERAQADAERSTNLSLLAAFLGAALGGPIGLAAPPVGVGVGVAFAAWAAALQRHVVVVQRVVRDPPDPDYRSATSVGPLRFDVELLAGDDFGRVSTRAIQSLLHATSLCAAMIRALERAQGARLAGQAEFEEARFEEATRYARRLGEDLRDFANSSAAVTEAVRGLPPVPQVLGRGGRLVTLLSDAALAELYRMGVPRSELEIPVMERVNDDPRELFSRDLESLARACPQLCRRSSRGTQPSVRRKLTQLRRRSTSDFRFLRRSIRAARRDCRFGRGPVVLTADRSASASTQRSESPAGVVADARGSSAARAAVAAAEAPASVDEQ